MTNVWEINCNLDESQIAFERREAAIGRLDYSGRDDAIEWQAREWESCRGAGGGAASAADAAAMRAEMERSRADARERRRINDPWGGHIN